MLNLIYCENFKAENLSLERCIVPLFREPTKAENGLPAQKLLYNLRNRIKDI
jgi:hypothetical protein